jgi:plasmid stability protein
MFAMNFRTIRGVGPPRVLSSMAMTLSRYHSGMAQLIVRNIEDEVRDRLRELARRHGRSMEEEVRDILRAAVAASPARPARFGTRAAARFRGRGLKADITELRGKPAVPPELGR